MTIRKTRLHGILFLISIFGSLAWAQDAADAAIIQNLDFFQTMDMVSDLDLLGSAAAQSNGANTEQADVFGIQNQEVNGQ